MMYAVYDESGRITQANQMFENEPEKVESIMHDLGQRFIKNHGRLVSPDEFYVWEKKQRLRARQLLPITVSATTIRAGTSDAAVFRNIPRTARCTISTGRYGLHDGVMQETNIDLSIPLPCIYRVKFSLWPAQDAIFDIEGVAP